MTLKIKPFRLLHCRRLISQDRVFPDNALEQGMSKRLKLVYTLIKHFENRWRHEYITELRLNQRVNDKVRSKLIRVGDVVLVEEDKLLRNRWKIGE